MAHAIRPHGTTGTKRRVHRRHIRWNPLLRGSHESMLRQNAEIDRLQLPRISDDEQLEELIAAQELVPIEANDSLRLHPQLKPERAYCKPWTRDFLYDLGDAFYKEFRKPIQVNSAVRTMEQQRKLMRKNRNAAPAEGETASSHLAGLTIDISKRGLTRKQHKWIEEYFASLRDQGLIEAAEERRQAVFHVMVSERYAAYRETQLQENVLADTGTE